MARRGLKNLVRTGDVRNGQPTWKLSTLDGIPVAAFEVYCRRNQSYSYTTQKRYAEATSRFIDYLYEAHIFEAGVLPEHLNNVVDAYTTLLRDGSEVVASRIRESGKDLWLAEVAEALNWAPLKPKSFDNTMPAINRFLRLSESLAREAVEKAKLLGIAPNENYTGLIDALEGVETLSRYEVAAMRQHSMLGNVVKFAPDGLQRTPGLRGPYSSRSSLDLDFPLEHLPALLSAAQSWRDKAFWLTLAATGIRASEALNLHLNDVDMEGQKIFVFDPRFRRVKLGSDANRLRFKGREMAYTYCIPELKRDLFYALQKYLRLEFVPCYKPGETAYLFQYVEPSMRGRPYVDASYSTLARSFKRALYAAAIPLPKEAKNWTLQSLRHMYGVYMVNDFPLNPDTGQYGLPLVDVQMMMGHASIRSTAYYARSKRRRLEAKLATSDQILLELANGELHTLPAFKVQLLDSK